MRQTVLAFVAVVCAASCGTGGVERRVAADPVEPVAAARFEPFVDASRVKVAHRRLTESQYRHAVADVFGPGIAINARFEPEQRQDSLQAIGNSQMSITTTGLEQYFALARSIADQVTSEERRGTLAPGCTPTPSAKAETCVADLLAETGRRLFRRPLTREELDGRLGIWRSASGGSADGWKGVNLALVSLLVAPEFLFRVERAEDDPARPGELRLDAYTKASRLSYLFWDAAPDEELLAATSSGDIHTDAGLVRQIDRLAASPRLEQGLRAFFADMLHFEAFDTLTKDAQTYPRFSQAVADSAREETLRFLVDHLLVQKRDYRDIFTTRDSVINRPLAAIYDVPYASAEPWARITFEPEAHRAGILTQATFLSLFSHPGRSSPTIRGVRLNEIFLCVKTPDPPPDVDFSKVQAVEKGTVRTRLIDHMTNPGCSTCHRISDPPGLMLERFDGAGQYREAENGVAIDDSGELAGKQLEGAGGLGQYMHDSPLTASCLVRNVYYYSQGRPVDYRESAYLTRQTAAFAER